MSSKIVEMFESADSKTFIDKVVPTKYYHRGMLSSELFAVCFLYDYLNIDLLIESGTANGRSAEVFAKYDMKNIISIDTANLKIYSKEQNNELWESVKKRLSIYKNINFLKADSMTEIPKLLRQHKDKRVAINIDGPKDILACDLANICCKYDNVKFVSIHDQLHNKNVMNRYFKNVFYTSESWYRSRFKDLDVDDMVELKKRIKIKDNFNGFGVGIILNKYEQ